MKSRQQRVRAIELGQPVLFRDTSVILAEQLQMASDLSKWFNEAAVSVGIAQIDLEKLRDSLQSEIDRQISICFHLARVQALDLFGDETKRHAAMETRRRSHGRRQTLPSGY